MSHLNNQLDFQDRYEDDQSLDNFDEFDQDSNNLMDQQQQQQQQLGQQQESQDQEEISQSQNVNQQQQNAQYSGEIEVDQDYEPTEEEILDYAKYLGFDLPQDQELLWIARQGLKAPLPEPWRPCRNMEGDIYFFNFQTGSSIWEHPSDQYYRYLFEQKKAELQGLTEGDGENDDYDSNQDSQNKRESQLHEEHKREEENEEDENGALFGKQMTKEMIREMRENDVLNNDHNKINKYNQVVGVEKLPKQEQAPLQDELIQNSAHFAQSNQNSNLQDDQQKVESKIILVASQDEKNHRAHEFTLAQRGEFSEDMSEQNIQMLDENDENQNQQKSFEFEFQDDIISDDQFIQGAQEKKQKSKLLPKHEERRAIQQQAVEDRIYFAQQQETNLDNLEEKSKNQFSQIEQSLDFAQALDEMPTDNQNRAVDSPENFALNLPTEQQNHQQQQHLAQFGQNISQNQAQVEELKPFPAPRFYAGPPDSQNQFHAISQQEQPNQNVNEDEDQKYEQQYYVDQDDEDLLHNQNAHGQTEGEDDEQLNLLMEQCPQQIRDAIHMYQSSKHLEFHNFFHGLINGMADRAQIPSVQQIIYDTPQDSQENTQRVMYNKNGERDNDNDPLNQNEQRKLLKESLHKIQLQWEKKQIQQQELMVKEGEDRSQQFYDKYESKIIQNQKRMEQKLQNQRKEMKDQLIGQHELELQAINVKLKGMIEVEKLKIENDASALQNNNGAGEESRLLSHRGIVFSRSEREKEGMREQMMQKVKQWNAKNMGRKQEEAKIQIEMRLEQNFNRDVEKFKKSLGMVQEGRKEQFRKIKQEIEKNYMKKMQNYENQAKLYDDDKDDTNAKIAMDAIDTHRERKGILQKKIQLEYETKERELQKQNLDILKHGRDQIETFRGKEGSRLRDGKFKINEQIRDSALAGDLVVSKKSGNVLEVVQNMMAQVHNQIADIHQSFNFIDKQTERVKTEKQMNQKKLISLTNIGKSIKNNEKIGKSDEYMRNPSSSMASRIYQRQKYPQQFLSSSSEMHPILHQGDESSSFIILNSQQGATGKHFLPHLSSGQSSSLAHQRNIFSRHGMQQQNQSPKVKRSQQSQQYIRSIVHPPMKSYQQQQKYLSNATNNNNNRQSQCEIGDVFEEQDANNADYYVRNSRVKSVTSQNRGSRVMNYQDTSSHQKGVAQEQQQSRFHSISATGMQPSQNNSMLNMQHERINQLEGEVSTLKDLILITNQNNTLNSAGAPDISYQQQPNHLFSLNQQQQQQQQQHQQQQQLQILPTFGNKPNNNTLFSNYMRSAPPYSKSNNDLIGNQSSNVEQLNNSTVLLNQLREERRQFLFAIDEFQIELSVLNRIKQTTQEGRDNWEREKKENAELPVTKSAVSMQMTRDYKYQLENTNKSIQALKMKISEHKRAVELVKQIQKKVKIVKDSKFQNGNEQVKVIEQQIEDFKRFKIEKKIVVSSQSSSIIDNQNDYSSINTTRMNQQQQQQHQPSGSVTFDDYATVQASNTLSNTLGNNSSQLLAENRKKILNDQLSVLAYNQKFYQLYQRNLISMNRNRENLKAMLNKQMNWISSMKDEVNRTSTSLLGASTSRYGGGGGSSKYSRLYI